MSFIKDVINDFTRSNDLPLDSESVRKQAWVFLLFGILLLVAFVVYAFVVFYSDDPTITLKVIARTKTFSEITHTSAYGEFSTGHAGILQYKPQSIIDILILDSFAGFNLFDFAFFIYVGIILFKALRKVDEQDTFKMNISKAYKKVGIACFMMFFVSGFYGILMREFFEYRAGDQFSFSIPRARDANYFAYIFFGGIISSFAYFMNKGIALQEDKDLTI